MRAVCEVLFSLFLTPRFYQCNRGAQVCSFDLSLESFHIGSTLTASCYSHHAPPTLCIWSYISCLHARLLKASRRSSDYFMIIRCTVGCACTIEWCFLVYEAFVFIVVLKKKLCKSCKKNKGCHHQVLPCSYFFGIAN